MRLGLKNRLYCGAAASALLVAFPAMAQTSTAPQDDQASPSAQPTDVTQPTADALGTPAGVATRTENPQNATEVPGDIVVTGTLIRGTAPTGVQLNVVTADDIKQLGASNTSEVLATIPQDSNFNARPQVGSTGVYNVINAPRLRYLGNSTVNSNSTLLLLDGARLPGMGVQQTSADIDTVPIGGIRRIDIATDGGSATYGADAVGGVVNLVTRDKSDGIEFNGHFGGAADYRQYDVGGTVGHTFGRASIFASYQYVHNDLIRNFDRDYPRTLDYTQTPPVGASFQCSPGNFSSFGDGRVYPIQNPQTFAGGFPLLLGGTPNRCDLSRGATFFPKQDRHSAIVGLHAELSDSVTFDVKTYYTHRAVETNGGVNTYSLVGLGLTPSGPQVGFVQGNFGPSLGTSTVGRTTLSAWGVVPRLTVKLGGDFQVTTFLNVGTGSSEFSAPVVGGNNAALATAAAGYLFGAGARDFNPYTGTFADTPSGSAAQAVQANYYSFASGRDEITNARSVIDGPLLHALGGDIRAAVGVEYFNERFTARTGQADRSSFAGIVRNRASRDVKSAFGELSVPIVGADNRFAGVYALTLSAAGRYDDYSDFGGTFNPKFGASLQPIQGWTIRGNWGKSYQAPSLASSAQAVPPSVAVVPAGIFGTAPGFPATTGKNLLILIGGGTNLRPQKATTWEVGTEFKPSFVPGLSLGATYYNIHFNDQIAFPAFFDQTFYTLYPNSYTLNPTAAQISAFIAPASNRALQQQYVANPGSVYAIENGTQQNLARTATSGLDFNAGYEKTTGFGSLFASVAGTYILNYDLQVDASAPRVGFDYNQTIRFQATSSVGATVGPFLAKAMLNHSSPFLRVPTAANAFQDRVRPFNVVNLTFQYAPKSEGLLKDLSLTLNVDNVFDVDPPRFNGNTGYSGFTLGRLFNIGLSKRF